MMDFPSKIQVQTIDLCNYACPMCPYPEHAGTRGRASLEQDVFAKILREVADEARSVDLCIMLQNEPLLDTRFFEFVEAAHANPMVRSISTVSNGSTLSPERLTRLMGFERFKLVISVNAISRSRYLQVHGRDRWTRIHALLSGWQGPRARITVSCVASTEAGSEAEQFTTYWNGLGYDARILLLRNRADEKSRENAMHSLAPEFGYCRYPVDTLTVLANGDVIPCCQDWEHASSFGNLKTSTISEIWNGASFVDMRRAALTGEIRRFEKCRSCDYPIRSAVLARLEREITSFAPDRIATRRFMPHRARVDHSGGVTTVVVHDARSDGVLSVLLAGNAEIASDVRVTLPVAYTNGDAMYFECRGKLEPSRVVQRGEDLVPRRIVLDRDDDGFRCWEWYCADWRAA